MTSTPPEQDPFCARHPTHVLRQDINGVPNQCAKCRAEDRRDTMTPTPVSQRVLSHLEQAEGPRSR